MKPTSAQPQRCPRLADGAAFCLACLLGVASLPRLAADWPAWRGSDGCGIAAAGGLPTVWGPDQNVLWTAELPGVGWSQPIVWSNRVFVTTAVTAAQLKPKAGEFGPGISLGDLARGLSRLSAATPPPPDTPPATAPGAPGATPSGGDRGPAAPQPPPPGSLGENLLAGFRALPPPEAVYEWRVLCLDADTGRVRWSQTAHSGRPAVAIHRNNTYASETPATDGERLVAYFGMTGLFCYDLAGTLLWQTNLGAYPMQMSWGSASSPVLHDGRVFVQCDNEQSSFLTALDARTGRELWRVPRHEKSNWSTPFLWRNRVRTELVAAGGTRTRAYDPATGTLLWEFPGHGRTATTPVGDADLLYLDSYDRLTGGRGVLIALRAGATGDLTPPANARTNAAVAWTASIHSQRVASPLLYRGCLYQLDQQSGLIRCFDAQTGALHFLERLPGARGFSASPWAANGRVYCLDESGTTHVLAAGPRLEVLSANSLPDTMWASAAVAGRRLYLRGVDRLYCIATP